MDGFHEEPSDQVWDGLNDRLDTQKAFWQQAWFWITLLALLLMLGGFWGYRNSMQGELQDIMLENEQLKSQKINLQKALSNCADLHKKETLSSTSSNNNKTILSPQQSKHNTTVNTKHTTGNYSLGQNKQKHSNSTGTLNDSESKTTKEKSKISRVSELNPQAESEDRVTSEKESNTLSNKELKNTFVKLRPLPVLATSKSYRLDRLIAKKMNDIRERAMLLQMIKIEVKEQHRPSLRWGFSGNSFTTFTDLDTDLRNGWSAGLDFEYQLLRKTALTASLKYTQQYYDVNISDPSDADKFPHGHIFDDSLNGVSVVNRYAELPIGLKWSCLLPKGNTSWYVNPGVAWQFYFPQHFDYQFTSDPNMDISDHRFFLYFGSAFLNTGMEGDFSDRFHWQLGIWAEKGLVDYGLADRQVFNLGLRGAILFGK